MQKLALVLLGVVVVCSGCETLSAQQRRQGEMRRYNEMANLRASVQRIEQRLDGIEAGREDLYAQISDLRETQARDAAQHDTALQAIEIKLTAQTSAQESMRKGLVSELSRKMATIIKTQAPAPARHSESGYEHVVKPGQTLSEIAKAYGVSISVVTRANKLKNPDDLRVGQTLFIPE